jgi:hypothetical protein
MNPIAGRVRLRSVLSCVLASAWALAGCSDDANLGFDPNELEAGGIGGSANAGMGGGGRADGAGADSGGASNTGGTNSSLGGTAQGGASPNTGGTAEPNGMAGASEPVAGGSAGSSPRAGAGGTAGSVGTGEGGQQSGDGVVLTAVLDAGQIFAEWHNGSESPIFLRGCATADGWYREADEWIEHGAFALCAVEGPVVEVAAGATHRDPLGGTPPDRGDNVWRLVGPYGSDCTAGARFSAADCAAVHEAISANVVTIQ